MRPQGQDQVSISPKRRGKEQSPSRRRSLVPTTLRAKTSREKSPKCKTPRGKTPRGKSPRRLSKGDKSKSPESPKESRSIDKLPKPRSKSREENSPVKNSESRSPLDSTRKKSDSDTFASITSPRKKEMTESDPEVKESDISVSANVHKSPNNRSQLKSYIQIVPRDPTPLVPYDDDVMSISPRDSADGLNVLSEKEISNIQDAEPQKSHKSKESKHKGSDEGESGKKIKVKKKSKKSLEKKRKKKALAKNQALENAEKNTDDELEDLLFTKTNKESKEEDVFNDSEVFSAKHNLRTTVVDLNRKKLRTVGSPVRNEGKLSPLRKVPLESKKPSPLRKDPLESKKLSSIIVVPRDSPEPYEPEKFSEISETEVHASEVPLDASTLDDSPAQAGFSTIPSPAQAGFSTIPFLSVDEEPGVSDEFEQTFDDDNVEQTVEDYNVEELIESEPYSPLEHPVESNDAPYSPVEEPVSDFGSPKKSSTMNLSDISTKDTVVENTVGIVTAAEKVQDFLGSIQPPEQDFGVVDMDMSSSPNGIEANSDNDDDIIEQLHKEFVRTQHQEDVQPAIYMDNHVPHTSSIQQIPGYPTITTNIPSPLHTAASDPIVQTYGLNTNYGTILKPKRPKRSKKKKLKIGKEDNKPLAREKKDIEVRNCNCSFYSTLFRNCHQSE